MYPNVLKIVNMPVFSTAYSMISLAMDIYNRDALLVDLQTFIYNIIESINTIFFTANLQENTQTFQEDLLFCNPGKKTYALDIYRTMHHR